MVIVVLSLFHEVKCMDTCTQNQQKGLSSLDGLNNQHDYWPLVMSASPLQLIKMIDQDYVHESEQVQQSMATRIAG